MSVRHTYYRLKPCIPRALQLAVRRARIRLRLPRVSPVWPIDPHAAVRPDGWPGWPGGKAFALVLTHDVETDVGHARSEALMDLERALGFRAAFNLVPEKYTVAPELRRTLTDAGCELGVHGLNHDGRLYSSRRVFRERCIRINQYIQAWGATGFRSPAMHHNLEWLHDLTIQYDCSTFDTDPFEPQNDGVGTIFPFWVPGPRDGTGYVELPYTLPQDFLLFVLMREHTLDIWKRKLAWVAANGGMALVLTHPDYMAFGNTVPGPVEYPAAYYRDFLAWIAEHYTGQYWQALPREVAAHVTASRADSPAPSAPAEAL